MASFDLSNCAKLNLILSTICDSFNPTPIGWGYNVRALGGL